MASARRSAEERRVRELVAGLTAVDGLVHLRTRFLDRCTTPVEGDLLEPADPHALECGIQATVHFGISGNITDVLPRIRAARIASWGAQTETGQDVPGAGGTVAYALRYHRDRGKYPDGTLMPGPRLESPGLRVDWDRPGMPLPYEVEKPAPCPSGGTGRIYQRCEIVPAAPMSLTAARARYGTVLVFDVLGPDSGDVYFTVARSR
ncbi:hypothetical protein [Streptomyces sp. IBSBF 3010]|uniref:hypothetical protein n=1 Tax=Streptomyces sp. IBSBF 3010 TaxID=2903526 RepID=UPI002FDC3092